MRKPLKVRSLHLESARAHGGIQLLDGEIEDVKSELREGEKQQQHLSRGGDEARSLKGSRKKTIGGGSYSSALNRLCHERERKVTAGPVGY